MRATTTAAQISGRRATAESLLPTPTSRPTACGQLPGRTSRHSAPAQAIQRVKFSVIGRELRLRHLAAIRAEVDVTTMTIRFTGIGEPQIIIKAPAHAIPLPGASSKLRAGH